MKFGREPWLPPVLLGAGRPVLESSFRMAVRAGASILPGQRDWSSAGDVVFPPPDTRMQIKEAMSVPPARIRHDSDLYHAAEIVALSQVSDLMVVDGQGSFVGVLSEDEILRSALPDFDEAIQAGGTLNDAFEIFLRKGKMLSGRPIMSLVDREPVVLDPEDHVAKAAVVLVERSFRRLPVVNGEGKLVGTISRADICRAVIGAL